MRSLYLEIKGSGDRNVRQACRMLPLLSEVWFAVAFVFRRGFRTDGGVSRDKSSRCLGSVWVGVSPNY